ncbi:MAG: rubrerythrin family protein [Candidatus Hydrothermarchaeales archaeon]
MPLQEVVDIRQMTEDNLKAAFAGESQAHMRYLIFADRAEKDGLSMIARLFRAIAYAEQVHATNHFNALDSLGKSPENLEAAIEGETFEVEEMYPAYNAVAELQNEEKAKKSIHYAIEAEKIHADLYSKAKASAEAGRDVAEADVQICSKCGHTVLGDAPDYCPVCGTKKDLYKTF